ncbi:hypothetical protein QBC38DRAFT_375746 [Podospora fimiseda]|uniref:Ankyrin repeat protein n=1 Tax=Podospora fimiseda TaxID=252190 RepID=A0AAN7BDW9_9PEZI|nr:hypothetical protein QBC38DRAFT_375746 [Podospora fimiseda]
MKHDAQLKQKSLNSAFTIAREAHPQWPLQLMGTPLCVAISVNSLIAVDTLLSLGANPLARVYADGNYAPNDPRSHWTAFHIATRHHCPEILQTLLGSIRSTKLESLISEDPLAIALSYSTPLERRAMHGSNNITNLKQTVRIIQRLQPLSTISISGITALMQAIDFSRL